MIKNFNLIAACDLENGIGLNGDLPWSLTREYQYFQFVTQRVDEDRRFAEIFQTTTSDLSNERKSTDEHLMNDDSNNESYPTNSNNTIERRTETNSDRTNGLKSEKTKQELLFNEDDRTESDQVSGEVDELCQVRNCLIMGRLTWQSIPEQYRPLKNRLNLVVSRGRRAGELKIKSEHLFKSLVDALAYASAQNHIRQIFVVGGEQVYRNAIKMNECKRIYLTRIGAKFDCDRFFPPIDEERFEEIDEFSLKDKAQYENGLCYRFHIYERIVK